MISALLAMLLTGAAQAAPVPPSAPAVAFVPSIAVRTLANAWKFQFIAGGEWRWEGESREFKALQVGTYFRILPWLQTGIFYQGQYGARHSNDWVSFAGTWAWLDTQGRREDLGIIDLTVRQTVGGEGSPWLLELKTRLLRNFFNGEMTFMFRPGVFYYWMRGGRPFFTFFTQVESYAALNFLPGGIHETWIYAGALYSATSWLQLGLRGEFHSWTWGTSSSYEAITNTRYNVTAHSGGVVLFAVLPFDLTPPK